MTHILVSILIALLIMFAMASTRWCKAVLGRRYARVRRYVFSVLVLGLWVFSVHETVDETGLLYGLTFSLIPLVGGWVILTKMPRA